MDFMKGIACHISKSSWDLQYLETGGTGGGGGSLGRGWGFGGWAAAELKKIVSKRKIAQNYKTSWNSSNFIDVYSINIDLGTRYESCQ